MHGREAGRGPNRNAEVQAEDAYSQEDPQDNAEAPTIGILPLGVQSKGSEDAFGTVAHRHVGK